MSNRTYPRYAGREKYRSSKPKTCACCSRPATHVVTIQMSVFRGDDDVYNVCEDHSLLARTDYHALCDLGTARQRHLEEVIKAQHEETGRRWTGERRALPPRYHECTTTGLSADSKRVEKPNPQSSVADGMRESVSPSPHTAAAPEGEIPLRVR